MNMPNEIKPLLWGAAAGAIVLATIGFAWGGWVTGGKAELAAQERASAGVIGALAPICVDKFRSSTESGANLVALKKIDSWAQGEFVEKGGWATVAGGPTDQVSAVARACAELLAKT